MKESATEPIPVMHLFPKIERKLVRLLRSLSQEQWQTKALPNWTVKDVAAHLLDTNLRRLSIARDGFWGEKFSGSGYQELVDFLNRLNADWVAAFRRVSPQVLVDLLEQSSREVMKYFASLDPSGTAVFPVAWAGESASQNWFDIAREYTERWHHQQQIRDAVGQPGIMTRELYCPVLDTFMRALPVAYKEFPALEGTSILITVTGKAGGSWALTRSNGWQLSKVVPANPAANIILPPEIAWKLFTKALSAEQRAAHIRVKGDSRLAEPIARATAIMG